ncbi:MAG: hypothetical protein ABW026_06100 [Microvirga sp.]
MIRKHRPMRPPGRFANLAPAPALAMALALAVAGCASLTAESPVPIAAPTQLSIANQKPSGKVTLTEVFVGGAGVGKGVLTFRGKTYPFRLAGTVIGPGSVLKRQVAGEIYDLNDISAFDGIWVEGTGPVGLETGSRSELWLGNKAGVVMHLTGTSEGMTLSLGKDEVLIEITR